LCQISLLPAACFANCNPYLLNWYDRLLYPKIPLIIPNEDSLLVEKIKELSRFYGGQPEFVKDPDVLLYYHKDILEIEQKTPVLEHKNFKRTGC